MTYPIPNYSRVWIRGRIIDLGKAAIGADNYGIAQPVRFTPSPRVLLNAGTKQIISTASFQVIPSAQDGYFAIQLPASDDPDINPTNFTYAVAEPTGRAYNIIVPQDTPPLDSPGDPLHGQPVLDLISVVPASSANAGSVQLLTGVTGPAGPQGVAGPSGIGLVEQSAPSVAFAIVDDGARMSDLAIDGSGRFAPHSVVSMSEKQGVYRGPNAPTPATGSGEYVWFKTDGSGALLDILSGKV